MAAPVDNPAVFGWLQSLEAAHFWGNITLRFQHGDVVHIIREETLKPEQVRPENPRSSPNATYHQRPASRQKL